MNIGVFTTIKIKNGIPLFFDRHRERLLAQAAKLNLEKVSIRLANVQHYLKKNNLLDCALKITITKEDNKTSITYKTRPLPQTLISCKAITIQDTRNYLKIYKTTNRILHDRAKKIAMEHGADDAIFTFNEKIVESTICNIFSVNKQGEIITPPMRAKGLNGITRQLIIEQTNVIEIDINQNTKGPLVLVNSLRIQKVTHLNGKKLLDGEKLMQKIKKIIEKNEEAYLQKL